MLKTILTYGVIAGLLVGVPLSVIVLTMHQPNGWGMAIGYSIMLIALSTIFLAIKRRRDIEGGGVIRFWPALGLGLGISVVAGVFYVVAWESAVALTGLDFAATYSRAMIEQQRAAGVTGAELARFEAEMAQFRANYADPMFRWPMTFAEIFPVGVLVSLVSAGLLRFPGFMPARRSAPVEATA